MTALLAVAGMTKRFGGLVVADAVDFTLQPGERVALIGPNGAGKTTFVNLVTGILAPNAGSIHLDGRDVTRLKAAARVRLGLVRSFQVARLFPSLTALEHVSLAILERQRRTLDLFRDARRIPGIAPAAEDLLAQLGLAAMRDRPVAELAYGQQRLLEIALALALKPRVLILDEPAAGVPHAESHLILAALDRLPPELGVIMIDHDMDLVFRFAHRIVVLAQGQVLCSGSAAEISADPRVRAVYLGSRADAIRPA